MSSSFATTGLELKSDRTEQVSETHTQRKLESGDKEAKTESVIRSLSSPPWFLELLEIFSVFYRTDGFSIILQ